MLISGCYNCVYVHFIQTPDSFDVTNIYRVVMDHRASGPLADEYLNVKEGDLVEVLETKGNNFYVAKFSSDSAEEDEEEEEGYVPACCVEPLPHTSGLNHNSNNNRDCNDWSHSSPTACSLNEEERRGLPSSDLQRDWSVFCLRTGRFEPFPECSSEHELLNAKMDSLVKYYSDQHQRLGLSSDDHIIKRDETICSDERLPSERCVLRSCDYDAS